MVRRACAVSTSPNIQHRRSDGRSATDGDYAALVTAAAGGDRDALERLLIRAQEVAYRFSLTVCQAEDAEDVMQEALLKTYRHVKRIRHPEAFRSWLYRTVRNACFMRHRRRVHEPAGLLSLDEILHPPVGARPIEVPDPGRDPEALAMNATLRRRLRQALGALPPALRMIVFLREMEGLSTREVAQVTRLSEANVKTRLHRARLFLQRQLGDAR
jgi:RNA polymerase sigma-70 factor (ECF subfamily)